MARRPSFFAPVHQFQLEALFTRLYELKQRRGLAVTLSGTAWRPSWDDTGEYLVLTRGPVVVIGKWRPEHYFVLASWQSAVEVVPGNVSCIARGPGAADAVPVTPEDPGPWWDVLVREIPAMEAELARLLERLRPVAGARTRALSRAHAAAHAFLHETA